jgi:hypothetical protein
MLVDQQLSPPRCPECSRSMRLIHVLPNRHVYPPVRTFECVVCERDTILAVAAGGTCNGSVCFTNL